MKQKLTFLALRSTRVGDSSVIVNAYSLEHGRIAIASPVGKGAKAGSRRVALLPMTLVECQGERRPGREFFSVSEPRVLFSMGDVYGNPVKNAVALFLTELLTLTLREQPADPALFAFLADSVMALSGASPEAAVNFHICFLIRLSFFLGIEPDISTWRPGRVFDLYDGVFRDAGRVAALADRGRLLDPDESAALRGLMRIDYSNMHLFVMGRDRRNAVLNRIVEFYTIHYTSLSALKSLDILRTLF